MTCSLGLHPWYLQPEGLQTQLGELGKWAALPNVIAIGECGLDKLTNTDWDLQVNAFAAQIALANELKKPLIIHCVKAYEEVLLLLKDKWVAVPVIFHGFNKNPRLAEQIIKSGYYLSFGAALLQPGSGAAKTIVNLPADRFFLETDDVPITIQQVYETCALLLKTQTDALILQLHKNYQAVFTI